MFCVCCRQFSHPSFSATFYTQNGNYGACGEKHSDDDLIAALDYRTYGDLSAKSKYCGKMIKVSWQGKSVNVRVEDACPSCNNAASVDLSKAAFRQLADEIVGELSGSEYFDQSPRLSPLMIVSSFSHLGTAFLMSIFHPPSHYLFSPSLLFLSSRPRACQPYSSSLRSLFGRQSKSSVLDIKGLMLMALAVTSQIPNIGGPSNDPLFFFSHLSTLCP